MTHQSEDRTLECVAAYEWSADYRCTACNSTFNVSDDSDYVLDPKKGHRCGGETPKQEAAETVDSAAVMCPGGCTNGCPLCGDTPKAEEDPPCGHMLRGMRKTYCVRCQRAAVKGDGNG